MGPITIAGAYNANTYHSASLGKATVNVLRSTITAITPNTITAVSGGKQLFTVTVTDSSSGTQSYPSGKVTWKASVSGGIFNSNRCTLAPISSSQSSCHITYTAPAIAGIDSISGTYGGDNMHVNSSGKAKLTVT
jgi:hypothetical protein